MPKSTPAPRFLTELLHARSPSGYEFEAQAVFDRHVKPAADTYASDALGNRLATLRPDGDPVLMLAGHMDELGLLITALVDAIRRPKTNGPKWMWILIIILINLIGPIVYFIVGRKEE